MADPARIFLLAGEPSGDRIGADLVKRLRTHRRVTPIGVGGADLEGEGLHSLFPMSDLSVMGFADVLARLPLLLWRARQTAQAIIEAQPDLVVLIDSQVFSQTVAGRVRKAGYKGQILLYVAPSVWAWKPERAPMLRPLYDEILAVLPFEPAVMKRLGGPPTSYVGHPALDHTTLRSRQPERGPLLLLPGSRPGELRRHLPLMRDVARALRNHPRVTGFVLPTPRSEEGRVVEAISGWDAPVFVTATQEGKRQAFGEAVAAVAVSGTVTLELALTGTPMVVTYVADGGQMRRWRKYKGQFAALPNILVGEGLVPEVLGQKPQPDAVLSDLEHLLGDPSAIERQRAGFARIRTGMQKGAPDAPLQDAAERVLAHLG
ncbi:MAG: lipid-A-disaccharide synthase [Devosia nanyangense]|uniref:Lipid-A-disaccharide synthase n=1 Tax=Devosia nanyangense TaxID=1228055 RepID=A0A933NXA0_9HYPH|nr:lipid-A-disaccharide synthase [Devosia nanyangense]